VVNGLEVSRAKPEIAYQVKKPRKYRVLLVNDDYTPMDFVVEVLVRFFCLSQSDAISTMLQVHRQGRGVCGLFTREIAEAKVVLVNGFSQEHEYPLLCQMEPE